MLIQSIDLTPDGFACSVIGVVRTGRAEGRRFLFLFNETHNDYSIIRQNLLYASILIDNGFITCVGVEGEYDFEDWDEADIVAESQNLFEQHGNDLALINYFAADAEGMDLEQPGLPHFFFGTCLKLLRPNVAIKRVEADEFEGETAQAQADIIAKHAHGSGVSPKQFSDWIHDGSHKEQTDKAMMGFRGHAIHVEGSPERCVEKTRHARPASQPHLQSGHPKQPGHSADEARHRQRPGDHDRRVGRAVVAEHGSSEPG